VGTLTFPTLSSPACTAKPPTDTCYRSNNDLAGITANALSIDDGRNYSISGSGITLGSGGLTASSAASTFASAQLMLPITLSAAQTWSVDGNNSNNQIGLGTQSVTGPGLPLTIALNNQTSLGINRADVEVGPVTVTSSDPTPFANSLVLDGGKLDASNGQTVSLNSSGAGLFVPGNSTIGSLTSFGAHMQIGNGNNVAAKLSVSGGVSLDSSSALTLNVVKPGTVAGTDYSQITATGGMGLGGALTLAGANTAGACPTLHTGDVETLLSSSGSMSGTFTGIPNGSVVPLSCHGGTPPTITITYSAHSVTGTVLTAGGASTVTNVIPNAGPTTGTNTVTIKGKNFVSPVTVRFGTTTASSATFISSSEVQAVAPAHATGVVDVTVSCDGATSPRSSNDLYAYGPPTVSTFTPISGITGSSVTINGTNFVPRAVVKFGSHKSSSVTFVSATRLKATVPDGAVVAPISVTTAAGSGTSSTSFTPTLSITSFTPTSGPPGTSVTIHGRGFTATSTVAFNGTPASATFVSSGELDTAVPAGATSGPITVTNTKGTVSSGASFTVT
jgi:hypothetical protein